MFEPIVNLIKKFAPELEAEAVKGIVNLGEPELTKFLSEKFPNIPITDIQAISSAVATELSNRLEALVKPATTATEGRAKA